MWNTVLNFLIAGINACFGWFDRMMQGLPGSWDTIFTIITILLISRFILKPIVGWTFTSGSDKVAKKFSKKEEN